MEGSACRRRKGYRYKERCDLQIANRIDLTLAFAKQVAMNDARVIGRQLARLYPRAHEALGYFLNRMHIENRIDLTLNV